MEQRKEGDLIPIGDILKRHPDPRTLGSELKRTSDMADEIDTGCVICGGLGVLHPRRKDGSVDYSKTIPCDCVKAIIEEQKRLIYLEKCELPRETENRTFLNFKVYPEVRKAYELALKVADGSLKWLILSSGVDTGKTHLAIAICREWLARGKPAKYGLVPLLLDELRDGFSEEGDNSYQKRFDFLLKVPLLVLDDLGTENPTAWVHEKLEEIVDYRYINALPLVATTNLSMEELPERIASRFLRADFSQVVDFEATQYRKRRGK
jgi:DNA replication protein DnaC